MSPVRSVTYPSGRSRPVADTNTVAPWIPPLPVLRRRRINPANVVFEATARAPEARVAKGIWGSINGVLVKIVARDVIGTGRPELHPDGVVGHHEPFHPDASVQLAGQLLAAKLNVFNGSNVTPASAAIADRLLDTFAGKLPYGVKPSSAAGQALLKNTNTLINYNSGPLTRGVHYRTVCSPRIEAQWYVSTAKIAAEFRKRK